MKKLSEHPEVISLCGGRAKDQVSSHMLFDLPTKAFHLRRTCQRVDASDTAAALQGNLSDLVEAKEELDAACVYHTKPEVREEIHLDMLADMDSFSRLSQPLLDRAHDKICSLGQSFVNDKDNAVEARGNSLKPVCLGNPTDPNLPWHAKLPTKELARMDALWAEFDKTLNHAPVCDTIDQDITDFKQESIYFV